MLKRFFTYPIASHISLVFIGLMFLVPFVNMYHQQPMPSFFTEWIAGLCGLIAILPLTYSSFWRASPALPQLNSLKIPQISIVFIGLSAILCVQWAVGMLHSSQYALLVLSYFTWAFLLIILGSYLRRELGMEKLVTVLAWCLVTAGIINVAIVVLQVVVRTGGVIPFLPSLWSYGALSQTNHIADFCALATASLIYLYGKERFSLSSFSLLLVCFIVMLSLSGSRSVWLYLAALTIFISLLHINFVTQGKETIATRRAWRAGVMLLPTFILVQIFIYNVIPDEYVNLPTERLLDGISTLTSWIRLQFWYDSFRIFLESPWLGVGVGKFITNTFLLIDTPSAMASKRVFEHAHNLFFHLLAEMGIGSVLIVSAGLFAWIKAFKWRELSLETCWLISLLAILGIHSMLEYPLWFAFFLGITAILLGAGDENPLTINISFSTTKFVRLSLILIWALGMANLSTLLIANIKVENWLQKFAHDNINDSAELEWVQSYSLLSPYGQLMEAVSMGIDEKLVSEQFLLNQSVMNFRPLRTVTYQQALLLEFQGQHENAVKQLNRALIAFPTTFNTVLENAPLEYKQKYLNLYSEVQLTATNHHDKK